MHLPLDYPRINQFPEWFTVQANGALPGDGAAAPRKQKGAELVEGLPMKLKAGEAMLVEVKKP